MTVAGNLTLVLQRVHAACARAGRETASVTLLAVSKLQPVELVVEAARAGHLDFAENYAQELRDKAAHPALAHVKWHCIGPLQTNKAKLVAARAFAFHALDRVEIARELSKRRPEDVRALACFVEVNIAGEATKHGVAPADVPALIDATRGLPRLAVAGLMCMPPPVDAAEESRVHFAALRELARAVGVGGLSMGTTDDFEVAIEEGATHVRVGRAIFGERATR